MTQIATVERLLDTDHAVVSVPRKSACGHDCEECAGCGVSGAAVTARALNPIGAKPGQKVVVESSTRKMLGIVALVYAIPVALFLLGYVGALVLGDVYKRQMVEKLFQHPPPDGLVHFCRGAGQQRREGIRRPVHGGTALPLQFAQQLQLMADCPVKEIGRASCRERV